MSNYPLVDEGMSSWFDYVSVSYLKSRLTLFFILIISLSITIIVVIITSTVIIIFFIIISYYYWCLLLSSSLFNVLVTLTVLVIHIIIIIIIRVVPMHWYQNHCKWFCYTDFGCFIEMKKELLVTWNLAYLVYYFESWCIMIQNIWLWATYASTDVYETWWWYVSFHLLRNTWF